MRALSLAQRDYEHTIVFANAGDLTVQEDGLTSVDIANRVGDNEKRVTLLIDARLPAEYTRQLVVHKQLELLLGYSSQFVPRKEEADGRMAEFVSEVRGRNFSISSIESCTGGRFGLRVHSIDPGLYRGGKVVYGDMAKENMGLPGDGRTQAFHYTPKSVRALATSGHDWSKADVVVAFSGLLRIVRTTITRG